MWSTIRLLGLASYRNVLFKAAYDENDGPVNTLLPAGQVALKAMDISLRPTNKKVRGIFGTPNKATSAMVPAANGMGGMMGGMNPGMMGGMAGMMGMCGMPAASSMFGLMQWMKQQQEAMQSGGLNNLQIFSPGGGSSSSTPACPTNTEPVDKQGGAATGQTQSQQVALVQQHGSPAKEENKPDPFTFNLPVAGGEALQEATKVSDALDQRKHGENGKRTADEFEEDGEKKGKAKAKAKAKGKG